MLEYHATFGGGHVGAFRTYACMALHFHWSGMCRDIAQFVKTCMICQQANDPNTRPAGLLQLLPVPSRIWDDIVMDFISGLPLSKGFSVIFVIVDRLSKHGHFMPLRADYMSTGVAEVFLNTIVKLHGIP